MDQIERCDMNCSVIVYLPICFPNVTMQYIFIKNRLAL